MQKKSPRPLYISWKSLHLRKPSMNLTREEYMAESYWQGCYQEKHWIPKLQQISTWVIRKCFRCKKLQLNSIHCTTTRYCSVRQNYMKRPFKVTGTNFGGPIVYHSKKEKGMDIFYMQFNKSNPFRITARTNHR